MGSPRSVGTVRLEEDVLREIDHNSSTGTRAVSRTHLSVSHTGRLRVRFCMVKYAPIPFMKGSGIDARRFSRWCLQQVAVQ